MMKRVIYIDRIKGIAILLMVLAHLYKFPLQMSDNLLYKFIGSFHIHLFMFISGFVAFIPALKINGGGIYDKWKKRFFGYLCPAMMIGWLLMVFQYLVFPNTELTMRSFIGGAWYLKCMAIFCCIQFMIVRIKHVILQLLVCAFFYGLFMYGWKHNEFLNQLLVLEHCTCFFPFFVLGYYTKMFNLLEYLKDRNWIYTVALISYLFLFFYDIENHLLMNISTRFVRPVLAIISIVYLFMLREGKDTKIEHWLTNIGRQTLDIYIYHGYFILGVLQFNLLFIKDWAIATNNHVLCLIMATAVSVLIAYVSIIIGKIIRTSNFFRKLIYGQFWS